MQTKHYQRGGSTFTQRILICAINGSSRINGQTARLLKRILRDAQALGAKTKLIHLAQHPLQYCDGSQEPQVRSDIRGILEVLEEADGIVFGTPTYWFNMSGLMKNFIDRLTVTEKGWMLENKVAGFVATGAKYEDGAMMAITSMAGAMNGLGMIIFPYSMLYFRGQGRSHPKWAKDDLSTFSKRMLNMIKIIRRSDPL
jgi:multimeric flavodoxin WrbA